MPLTAAQITTEARAIAKCPGYAAQSGRALNLVLSDLVLHRNLKVNLTTASIPIAANSNGPFNLEANYLRTYDMSYVIQGETFFLNPGSLREYDSETQKNVTSNYPYEWASDLSPVAAGGVGLLYIYPQSNVPITIQHRYFVDQADITTPETNAAIPWFADQDYLITATAMRLMRITDDTRYDHYYVECDRMLAIHLLTEGDEQQVVKEIALDPRRFHFGTSSRPTKLDPW